MHVARERMARMGILHYAMETIILLAAISWCALGTVLALWASKLFLAALRDDKK